MAGESSYTITLRNNRTEQAALQFLRDRDARLLVPDAAGRRAIMELLGLPQVYARAFDLVLAPGHTSVESVISMGRTDPITLIEIKSTRKRLANLPFGFFFGATENEFRLAKLFGDRFLFSFVCLHPETQGAWFLTLDELNSVTRTKRTQFQINLQSQPSGNAPAPGRSLEALGQ